MAVKNRFSKPVAFNHTNEVDQSILQHVEDRNFSGYVKELILADIKAMDRSKARRREIEPIKKDGGIKIVIG